MFAAKEERKMYANVDNIEESYNRLRERASEQKNLNYICMIAIKFQIYKFC
jgi:hypothetical protein